MDTFLRNRRSALVLVLGMLLVYAGTYVTFSNLDGVYEQVEAKHLDSGVGQYLYRVERDGGVLFFTSEAELQNKHIDTARVQRISQDPIWNPRRCAQMMYVQLQDRIVLFETVYDPADREQSFKEYMYVYTVSTDTLETYKYPTRLHRVHVAVDTAHENTVLLYVQTDRGIEIWDVSLDAMRVTKPCSICAARLYTGSLVDLVRKEEDGRIQKQIPYGLHIYAGMAHQEPVVAIKPVDEIYTYVLH